MDSNVLFLSVLLFFPGASLSSLALYILLSGYRETVPAKVYFGGLVYFYSLMMLYVAGKPYFFPDCSYQTLLEADLLILLTELPFIYIYIRLLIKPGSRVVSLLLKHQLPFLILFAALVFIRLFAVRDEPCVSFKGFMGHFSVFDHFFLLVCLVVFIVQFSCYVMSVTGLLKEYREWVRNIPGIRSAKLLWLYAIIVLLIAFTTVFLYYIFSVSLFSRIVVAGLAFIFLNAVAICGGLHRNVLIEVGDAGSNFLVLGKKKQEENVEERILHELHILFEEKRIYRECDLHLEDVAARVGSNRTYVSAAINERYKLNFFRFVNGYRIREAQALLFTTSEPIQDIAFAVGFKSISTFNYQFREYAGKSPKEWRVCAHDDMRDFAESGIRNC